MNNLVLDLAVIGVQKSATTWLNDCLLQHPDLNIKKKKNEDYYYAGPQFQEKGAPWYWSMFDENELKKGCNSVDYFVDPKMPAMLLKLNPKIKLILSLREPVSRSISAYYWYLRKSLIPNVPLEEALTKALQDYQNGQTTPFSELINMSTYATNLGRFLNQISSKNLHIIFFEEIESNPIQVLRTLFQFLDIDKDYVPNNASNQPKKNTYNKFLIGFQRLSKSKVMGKFADLMNQMYSGVKGSTSGPKLNTGLLKELKEVYEEDRQKLIEFSNAYDLPKLGEIKTRWN